ncbi:integral membrane protein [Penicillium lividum]|nr:integral membrane protein [Penicillium lividum]
MADGTQSCSQVIVLVIAFSLISVVGVWYRRRRDTKRGTQLYGSPASGAGPLPSRTREVYVERGGGGGILPPNQSQTSQTRLPPDSVASSSRTNVAPPRSVRSSTGNSRLQKQSSAAAVNFQNVETRQLPPS